MFGRVQKSQIRTYIGILYLLPARLESLEFDPLLKYVCYSDLPTEVNKILPPVSLSDGLSPEGSAWLCRPVLTSCVCLLIFFFYPSNLATQSIGKPHNGKHVKLVF